MVILDAMTSPGNSPRSWCIRGALVATGHTTSHSTPGLACSSLLTSHKRGPQQIGGAVDQLGTPLVLLWSSPVCLAVPLTYCKCAVFPINLYKHVCLVFIEIHLEKSTFHKHSGHPFPRPGFSGIQLFSVSTRLQLQILYI